MRRRIRQINRIGCNQVLLGIFVFSVLLAALTPRDESTARPKTKDDAVEYNNRGYSYQTFGNYDLALESYATAIALDATADVTYYNRGTTYNQMGQFADALTDLNQAIALNAQDQDYYVARSIAYYGLGQYAEALADLQQYQALGGTLDAEMEEVIEEMEAILTPTPRWQQENDKVG